MATVNKDFRVKNGLVVEGTTGTINGQNILTAANDTGDLSEGTNLYFTDARAKTSAASLLTSATLTNITITGDGAGLTITAENGVADSTTSDLTEGTNLYFTDARAISAVEGEADLVLSGTLTLAGDPTVNLEAATKQYVDAQVSSGIGAIDTDDVPEGSTNLYFTDARALSAVQSDYEAYADQAELDAISTANANTDTLIGDVTVDGTAGNTVTDRIATAVSNLVDSAPGTLDTLNELAAALGDDANFSTTVTNSIAEKVAKNGDTMTGFLTLSADPTNALHAATKQYVDAEVPDDTDGLSEGVTNLYFTEERAQDAVASAIASGTHTNITINYDDANGTLSFTGSTPISDTDDVSEGASNLYFTDERAQDAVGSAITGGTQTNITVTYDDESNVYNFVAENGVSDSNTDDLAEGSTNLYFTNARAVTALEAVVPNFTEVDLNSVATQVAATTTLADTNQAAVYSFDGATYRSAKFVVKAAYGSHTEVSEVLLTLDTSDNIAITEYAVVTSNGNLIDISAGMNGTDIELLGTAGTGGTDVTIVGTLLQ